VSAEVWRSKAATVSVITKWARTAKVQELNICDAASRVRRGAQRPLWRWSGDGL